MDRTDALSWTKAASATEGVASDFLLPSRSAALADLLSALAAQDGPVLLTGESGAGKTWLCRRLRAALTAGWRVVALDLSPWLDPAALGRGILRGLGLDAPAQADAASLAALVEDALQESHADSCRWVLVLDEAHNGSDELLEAVRLLGNRMGEPGGFDGILLAGQTPLARRLERRPHATLGARLAARVHLRPLDVHEFRDSLSRLDPARCGDALAVERFHRDVGGNPRRVFQGSGRLSLAAPVTPAPPAVREGPPRIDDARARAPRTEPRSEVRPPLDLSSAVPARPPLQVSEGVVEVGWDATAALPAEASPEAVDTTQGPADPVRKEAAAELGTTGAPAEEFIDDRYAAIQAWNEWSRARDERPNGNHEEDAAEPVDGEDPTFEVPEPSPEPVDEAAPTEVAFPGVRVEGQHGFAPYSQLFSRLRQPRDVS